MYRYIKKNPIFYILLVCGLAAGFLITAMPMSVEASVAIIDKNSSYSTNNRAVIYTEGYDYYFILESTPDQGRKLVMSTAPFVATCDGTQDSSGAYTVKLSSPGGDVFVRHFSHRDFQQYDTTYKNNGSGTVLSFKYSGQDYKTNCDFSTSNGLEFRQGSDIAISAMYFMLNNLRARDILLERYPYYVLSYASSSDNFILRLFEGDLGQSYAFAGVSCLFNSTTMQISGFQTISSGTFYPNSAYRGLLISPNLEKVNFLSSSGKEVILYSNMTQYVDGSDYVVFVNNPYPSYETLAGLSSPTPTPTPTPVPAVTYEYVKDFKAAHVINLTQTNQKSWSLEYSLSPSIYKDLVCNDIYMTAYLMLPSRNYVKEHFLTAEDRGILIDSEAIEAWRISGDADSCMKVLYEGILKDAAYSVFDENANTYVVTSKTVIDFREEILKNWSALYGDVLPKGYIDEVLSYAYIGVLALRLQEKVNNTLTYIGPATINYPVKYYMSYEDYGKELSQVGGYIELSLPEDTSKMTLLQMQERAGEQHEKETEEIGKEQEETNATIKKLKDELAVVNAQLELLKSQSALDAGGVFKMFQSLADGLSSSISGFRSISLAVGSVFAFLPVEITAFISLTFVSLLVIAIYRALRG